MSYFAINNLIKHLSSNILLKNFQLALRIDHRPVSKKTGIAIRGTIPGDII